MKAVAIIGAGLGGLVCGAALAKAGFRVEVFEKHTVPGGYATSYRRKVHGMSRLAEFEVSLHLMNDVGEDSPLRAAMQELGLMERVSFIRASSLYRADFPDAAFRVDSYDTVRQSLISRFPAEQEGLDSLLKLFIDIRAELRHLARLSEEGRLGDMQSVCPNLIAMNDLTLQDVFDRHIRNPQLQSLLAQQWMYYGLPPSRISAVYYANAWIDYLLGGGYYPKGRSQQISDALTAIIEEHGGSVHRREPVLEIGIENKKAVLVRTRKRVFHADAVVSNIDPKRTFGALIGYDRLPQRYVNRIEALEPSLSSVQAVALLNIDLPQKYGEHDHEIFLNEYYDLERGYRDVLEEKYETMPIGVTIYENLFSGYQPEATGKTTVSLFALSSCEGWKSLDKDAYAAKKERVTRVLLERLERRYPGVSAHVEVVELSTPRTNERYTGNFGGAIYGAQQSVGQSMHRRLPQTTPIENLFLAGAWTRPGGGYSGVFWSGYNLARQLIRSHFSRDQQVQGD